MLKTIIVSTDGSTHADKAAGLAGDLAGKYGARLVILHALMHHETPGDLRNMCERLGAPAELLARLDAEAEAMVTTMASAYAEVPVMLPLSRELLESIGQFVCDKAAKTAREHGATDVTVSLVSGAPAEAILGAAKHEKADMIVMGSRGLGRFQGLLLGAVSQRVSHLAECTCVTVK
jgi:nucleotide-binding universal stress UspA family protein